MRCIVDERPRNLANPIEEHLVLESHQELINLLGQGFGYTESFSTTKSELLKSVDIERQLAKHGSKFS